MIYDHDTDTKEPHNLFDEEFGPQTKALPPSRPITEPTPIAYQIGKTKLCVEFGKILQAVTRVGSHLSYDDILLRDRKLREVMDELAPHLKMQPLEGSHDPVTLIVARLNLKILYNKITCILHRKHMTLARSNLRYAHSRRSAIEASLDTLSQFRTVFKECQPNGRLRSMKWYLQSTSKDTLLPTMLVVLDLHHDNIKGNPGGRHDSQAAFFWTPEQRREMIEALESAREIWKAMPQDSVEAFKAGNILDIMINKIKNPENAPAPSKAATENFFGAMGNTELQPEHSAAVSLGMLSGGLTPSDFQSPGGTTYPNPDLGLGSGTGLTPNFEPDSMNVAANGAASPFSMFTNLPGGNMGVDQPIDWVSCDEPPDV